MHFYFIGSLTCARHIPRCCLQIWEALLVFHKHYTRLCKVRAHSILIHKLNLDCCWQYFKIDPNNRTLSMYILPFDVISSL